MRIAIFYILAACLVGCKDRRSIVTVYASQDQVYAEPILREFTRQTGIRVRAVYDSEAVKTVGLVSRLIAEKSNPQCDVFWNNEELRTRQLAEKGLVQRWVSVGSRSRRVVINTNLVTRAPMSLVELTNVVWQGKVAIAYPLFGTTAAHFLALRQHWGPETWERWCQALQGNTPLLVDGNSVVVQMVGRGQAAIGLTDSDDIASGKKQGMPIDMLPLEEASLWIPNTIAVMRNAPHPAQAERLVEYLQGDQVHQALVSASALEEHASGPGLKVDWAKLLREFEQGTATLRQVFLR